MCTALEGGINYWCCKAEVVGEYLGEYASEQISRGGELKLYDAEEDEVYTLTLDKLLKGIISRQGIFLIPALLILTPLLDLLGVQAAQPAADLITFLCGIPVTVKVLREMKAMYRHTPAQ